MKLFQKIYPLLGIILLLRSGIFFAESEEKNEKLALIRNTYQSVFGVDNLFNKKNENTDDWNKMLNGLEKYVKKNADGNQRLRDAFDLCEYVSDKLIETLNLVYDTVVASKGHLSKVAISHARATLNTLQRTKTGLVIRLNLFEYTSPYFSKKQKDARQVLLRLMLTIGLAVDKLARDFDALMKGRIIFVDGVDENEQISADSYISLTRRTYRSVFDVDNLFSKRNENTDDWYKMLSGLQKYVYKNSGGNETLLNAFALCNNVSIQLINALKIVYNSVFAKKGHPSKAAISHARAVFDQLLRTKTDLAKTEKILEDRSYFDEKQKDVRKVLLTLVQLSAHLIEQLIRDFDEQGNKLFGDKFSENGQTTADGATPASSLGQ